MLGRGSGDTLDVLGPSRRSMDLLAIVEATNAAQPVPFVLDYSRDKPEHPDNSFCRSDHAMYHRLGIPVVYLNTGAHQDYRMVTDEAHYIDYGTLGRAARLVLALTRAIGDRPEAIITDGSAPADGARYVQ